MNNIKTVMRGLPVDKLRCAITPDMWNDITIRQKYPGSAHRDTECIFIRGPRSFLNFFDTTAQDYPRLTELIGPLMPVLTPLLNALYVKPTDLGRIMLVKLRAHGHVTEHSDTGPYADAFERFHVVVSTNRGCGYQCGGEVCGDMQAGDAFWFDHHLPHSSHNYGSSDRIHLIVDALDSRAKHGINWSELCPEQTT